MEGITRLCFGASYAVALGLELARLARPQPALRAVALLFGFAGLFAQTAFLAIQRPTIQSPYGSLLFLAWVLSIFYLYGTVHHRRFAWAIFVLPVVLGLILLAGTYAPAPGVRPPPWSDRFALLSGEQFWGGVHGVLILLAAVGVSVGFLASVMYLFQARRLRAKIAPSAGVRLLSLERLEEMNRRAVNVAFPLLTVGLLVGTVLMFQRGDAAEGWTAGKVFGTAGLWLVFLVLLVLRYGLHSRGRHLAVGTIAAFVVMLATLAAKHPFPGGPP
ncbi:MAG TPA: cytochrome c biogenesis protein CcsA [Gemmataceae bacterium]|nr:cytochrome c biogenesis protein CcsA [Gemmataceae bacterium]